MLSRRSQRVPPVPHIGLPQGLTIMLLTLSLSLFFLSSFNKSSSVYPLDIIPFSIHFLGRIIYYKTPISTDRCANTERAWTAVNWIDARAPRPPYTKADTLISRPLSQPCVCSPSTPHFPNATHPHTSSHTSPHRTPLPSKHHWPPRATLETVGERVSAGSPVFLWPGTSRIERSRSGAWHHDQETMAEGAEAVILSSAAPPSVRVRRQGWLPPRGVPR